MQSKVDAPEHITSEDIKEDEVDPDVGHDPHLVPGAYASMSHSYPPSDFEDYTDEEEEALKTELAEKEDEHDKLALQLRQMQQEMEALRKMLEQNQQELANSSQDFWIHMLV